jgi:hypothetical protein
LLLSTSFAGDNRVVEADVDLDALSFILSGEGGGFQTLLSSRFGLVDNGMTTRV